MSESITYSEAIRQALVEEMRRDQRVLLIGEDVAQYGGAFKVTQGIVAEFSAERVRNTPISENTIVGLAVGAALLGLRPVVEIMFMDFITLAMDQIVNHAAKFHYMYGPEAKIPLVIRTPGGGGRCYGPTHSQSLDPWFMNVPDLVVLAPSTPRDAKAMLKAAIRLDAPVLFIESKLLYATRGETDADDAIPPLGVAAWRREGDDVTLIAAGRMTLLALAAAERLAEEGIEATVLDLRTLKPYDREAVRLAAERTGRVIVIEESYRTCGLGAELAAFIMESAFYALQAPVKRLAALETPIPCAPSLERLVYPNVDTIAEAARAIMRDQE